MKVAVILGNMLCDDGSMSKTMLKRLGLALKLNDELSPDTIIVSGGIANKKAGVSEASVMRAWLIKNGIAENKIVAEDKSKTTVQNAAFSVPIAVGLNADEIILCTSKEHMNRRFLNPVRLFKKKLKRTNIKLSTYTDN